MAWKRASILIEYEKFFLMARENGQGSKKANGLLHEKHRQGVGWLFKSVGHWMHFKKVFVLWLFCPTDFDHSCVHAFGPTCFLLVARLARFSSLHR